MITWYCRGRCRSYKATSMDECRALRTVVTGGNEWILVTCPDCGFSEVFRKLRLNAAGPAGSNRDYSIKRTDYDQLARSVPVVNISMPGGDSK